MITREELNALVRTLQGIVHNPLHDANQLNLSSADQIVLAANILLGQSVIFSPRIPGGAQIGTGANLKVSEWIQSFQSLVSMLKPTIRDECDLETPVNVKNETCRFLSISKDLRPFKRKRSTILRYSFLLRKGKALYRSGIRMKEMPFGQYSIGSADWERLIISLWPATLDISTDSAVGKNVPLKVSLIPQLIVATNRGRFRRWRKRICFGKHFCNSNWSLYRRLCVWLVGERHGSFIPASLNNFKVARVHILPLTLEFNLTLTGPHRKLTLSSEQVTSLVERVVKASSLLSLATK